MMWMKQMSTTTINTVAGKVKAFMTGSAVRRHVVIGIAVWVVVNLFVFFLLQGKISNTQKTFYSKGIDLTLGMADKSGSPILSTDI